MVKKINVISIKKIDSLLIQTSNGNNMFWNEYGKYLNAEEFASKYEFKAIDGKLHLVEK